MENNYYYLTMYMKIYGGEVEEKVLPMLDSFYKGRYSNSTSTILKGVIAPKNDKVWWFINNSEFQPVPLIGEILPDGTTLDLISGEIYPKYDDAKEDENIFLYFNRTFTASRQEVIDILSMLNEDDVYRYKEKLEYIKNVVIQECKNCKQRKNAANQHEIELENKIQTLKKRFIK